MRPLIIDDDVKAAIKVVTDYAEAHVQSTQDIMRAMGNPALSVGNNPNFVVHVPMGFRCVYSLEEQPMGLCRHLSVSIPDAAPGKGPNPTAVEHSLMPAFGFVGKLEHLDHCWVEEAEGWGRAVNILQRVDFKLGETEPKEI